MNLDPELTPGDHKAAALYALTLIEHMRLTRKIGPQAFPSYKRCHTQLSPGRCEIIIETSGDETTLTVYPPSATGLKNPVKVDLDCVLAHPSVTPPTLLGKQRPDLPFLPRFGVAEKLEVHGNNVPSRYWGELEGYIEAGMPTSAALNAMLCGDLMGAVRCGDDETRNGLHHIVRFMLDHLPMDSCGSAEKVAKWRKDQVQHRGRAEIALQRLDVERNERERVA